MPLTVWQAKCWLGSCKRFPFHLNKNIHLSGNVSATLGKKSGRGFNPALTLWFGTLAHRCRQPVWTFLMALVANAVHLLCFHLKRHI